MPHVDKECRTVSLLINAVMLLLNCLVLILHPYMHYLSLRHYFLYLNIVWTFKYMAVLRKYPELCIDTLLLYLMVLKIFPVAVGYGHL